MLFRDRVSIPNSSVSGRAAEDAAVAAAVSAEATMRAEAVSAPVVICGFGELGQTVANMLDSPAVPSSCGPYRA